MRASVRVPLIDTLDTRSQVRVLTLADWRSLGGAALGGPANWSAVMLKVIRAAVMKYAWLSVRNTPPAG